MTGPYSARLFRGARRIPSFLVMHQIVADGWSLGVLARELTAHYKARVFGGEPLPALPLRYADVVRRQRERLKGPALEAQEAYWKKILTPLPPVLELPTNFPRPPLETFNGAVESFLLPSAHVELLQRMSREHGVTLFMTLFAAFDVLCTAIRGATDIRSA